MEQNIIPFSANVFLKVVATDTESTTISTATPASFFCSSKEIPSLLKVSNNSGSTSLKSFNFFFFWGLNNNEYFGNLADYSLMMTN